MLYQYVNYTLPRRVCIAFTAYKFSVINLICLYIFLLRAMSTCIRRVTGTRYLSNILPLHAQRKHNKKRRRSTNVYVRI